jgi:hypothetical protein
MDGEERRALALKILSDVESEILENEVSRSYFVGFDRTLDGEPIPRYDGESPDGRGSFICEYMPLAAVETLISDCEQIYEETKEEYTFKIVFNDEPEITVRRMATIATKVMLINLGSALSQAFDESFLDARLIAKAMLGAIVAARTERLGHNLGVQVKATADARDEIEKASARVAESKRNHLRDLLSRLPHMIAETRRGPKKRITLDSVRFTRDKLKSENHSAGVPDIAIELGSDDSTIYKLLKAENKTLDEL